MIFLQGVFTFFMWNSFAQSANLKNYCVQTDSVQYYIQTPDNNFNKYYILSYKIHNTSDSIIWLWFEKKSNLDKDRKLKEYFFRIKGNISLFHILTDANVSIQDSVPVLFYTFLKCINVNDSFTIQILCSEEVLKEIKTVFNYLSEHIVIESNEIVSGFLGIYNLTKWNRIKFYEEDFIILPIEVIKTFIE